MKITLMLLTFTLLGFIYVRTYKLNKLYVNVCLLLTLGLLGINFYGFTKIQSENNSYASFTFSQFSDALGRFNVYKESNIDTLDEVSNLTEEVRRLYVVSNYLERTIKDLNLKEIKKDDFTEVITSLNDNIQKYLILHDGLLDEKMEMIESNYETYDKLVKNLSAIPYHLAISRAMYYDTFRVLTYEISFDKYSTEELFYIIRQLDEVIEAFE